MADEAGTASGTKRAGRVTTLNSRRLTGAVIKRVARALELPTAAALEDIRQMIDGKLSEQGRDPRDVQVIQTEVEAEADTDTDAVGGVAIELRDSTGPFLTIDPDAETELDGDGGRETPRPTSPAAGIPTEEHLPRDDPRVVDLQKQILELQERNASLTDEVSKLKREIQGGKQKYRELWRLNCEQLREWDDMLVEKDAVIERLTSRVTTLEGSGGAEPASHIVIRSHPSGFKPVERTPPASSSSPTEPGPVRRGKAPPVDPFDGEGGCVPFEDWLPSLERAAIWNGWSESDRLVQLAGHLRKRALQEWNLLTEEEKSSFAAATEALHNRLDPHSRILAAQEFRYAVQYDDESVADYIRRLELAYRKAYGREKMSNETRDALLFGQLQEGLKYALVRAPAVSGAQGYQQLCTAARNEERRLMELGRRRQNSRPQQATSPHRQQQLIPELSTPVTGTTPQRTGYSTPAPSSQTRKCFHCHQPGHFARNCPARRSEQTDPTPGAIAEAKQVCTHTEPSAQPTKLHSDPHHTGARDTNPVRVPDKGSRPRQANVIIGGVPTYGAVDSGADITIMGGDLFRHVASAGNLKKRNFKPADKIPRSYDQRTFKLDGKVDMDITFCSTTMRTPVYIKLDAAEQLLLSEGVCHQLGIIFYHPEVQPVHHRTMSGRKYKQPSWVTLPVPSEGRRESGSTSLTSENSMLLTSPSEERRQSGTSTTLTSEGPLLPVPSEERRESGSTSLTSENSMLLTSSSEERRQSGTSTTLTSEGPLLPVPSEECRESGSTSFTSENSMLLTSPSEERRQSGTSTTLTSEGPLLPVPSEERRESGSTSLTSENSMLLTSPSEERRQSGTSTTLTSDGPLRPVPSEERRESGSTSLTSENSMLLTSPSEERRQSGTSTTLTSEGPLLPVPSEERRESGSTSLTSENSMLLTSPSEERRQSGTSTTLTSEGPLLPVPSEECRESGSTSLTSENSMLLTSSSEERRQSGTSTTLTSDGPLRPVPSEESRESGSTSFTSENSVLLTSPRESDMRVVTTSFKNSLADVQVRLVRSVRLLPNHSQEVLVKLEGDSLSSPLLVEGTDDLRLETELVAEDTLVSPAANGMATIVLHNPSGFTQVVDTGSVIGKASWVSVESPQDATSRPVIAVKGASCPENHSCQGHNTEPETMEAAVRRVECVSASTHDRTRRAQMIRNFFGDTSVPAEYREQLLQLLVQYDQLFSLDEGERGETKVVEFQIDTGNSPPIRQRARRMPFAARAEVARQLRALQLTGVVRASSSPWASPVVLVRKKDGSHRFCVDYRRLNAVTKLDSYPLPRIDDLLDQLAHARYFTTLDLASGYWQIRVHEDSVPKTAFITPQGLYEFRVMPFGLTNAPSTFQRLMQQLLAGLNPSQDTAFVSVYIDDVLIYSHTMEEHLVHLRTVLQRLAEAGLKLKPEKCHFVRQEVEFLGHVITPKGLKTTARLVSAVEEFQQPTNAKQTRQFLGLCSFYRRFIPGFAKIAKPLHQLTRVGIPFSWTVERQRAFVMLKKKLCEAPVLAYPSFDKDFVLETDASTDGIGAVLSQRQEDSCMHPVAFASRSLSPAERNYGITDLETLAVVWAVSHFRCYLYGHAVTIYTDHSAVRAVLENPNSSGRHARWWTRVYSSGIKSVNIVYRPGKANSNADALSRNPVQVAPDEGIGESEVQVAAISSESVTPTTTISQLLHSSPPVLELQSFAVEQQKDKELADMVQYLQSKALPVDIHGSQRVLSQSPLFMLIDGVLYFIRKGCTPCPAVPQHLRQRLMEEHHRGPCGSHFGGKKLFQTMSRQWWWEGMHKDIMHFVQNCPECTIVSGGRKTVHPPLHPIPVQRPFQILGVDIMDLPLTKQGNRHILVFQDHFSKWPMVYAIPDQKANRIAQILCDEIIPMFGVPEALLSDRGTNLLSHLMKDVCQILGIKKLNTTAYHPQCNGMVERLNRTLKAMLRKHAGRFGTQWDQFLPGVLWAYRNTPHETTGEKPSFLLFGIDLRTPSQAALFPPALPDPTTIEDYRETLITTLSSAHELAAASIRKSQDQSKRRYDEKAVIRDFRCGDWVLVKFPSDETGRTRKLSRPWHGPYRVLGKTDTTLRVEKVYRTEHTPLHVHQSRVKFCPPDLPPGYYWYGPRHYCPGKVPRWVDNLLGDQSDGAQDQSHSPDQLSDDAQHQSHSPDQLSDGAQDRSHSPDQLSDDAQHQSHSPDQLSDGAQHQSHSPDQLSDGAQHQSHSPDQLSYGAQDCPRSRSLQPMDTHMGKEGAGSLQADTRGASQVSDPNSHGGQGLWPVTWDRKPSPHRHYSLRTSIDPPDRWQGGYSLPHHQPVPGQARGRASVRAGVM